MLLGLQQLFSSSKAQGMTESMKEQGANLANLSKTEGLGGFELELLNTLHSMNAEEAKTFMASLPQEMQGQLEQLITETTTADTNIRLASHGLAQDPKALLEAVEIEQGFETNGPSNAKSPLKDIISSLLNKNQNSYQVEKNGNRSPAIDFHPDNIDKKLIDFEDFNLQKNMVKKTPAPASYPGLDNNKELNLKSTEVVNAIANSEGEVQNSAQFILSSLIEAQGSNSSNNDLTTLSKVGNTSPVFDANQIKTSDAKTIIDQISNYIIQAKASKEPTVNFKMNHSELGQLDITVAKAMQAGEAVAINIGAGAVEGKNFFTQNLKELSTHLAQAGITVTDIKVESSSASAKSDFDFNQQQKHAESGQKQFGSEQNQRRHDQERRQNLWDLLSNREAA